MKTWMQALGLFSEALLLSPFRDGNAEPGSVTDKHTDNERAEEQ